MKAVLALEDGLVVEGRAERVTEAPGFGAGRRAFLVEDNDRNPRLVRPHGRVTEVDRSPVSHRRPPGLRPADLPWGGPPPARRPSRPPPPRKRPSSPRPIPFPHPLPLPLPLPGSWW